MSYYLKIWEILIVDGYLSSYLYVHHLTTGANFFQGHLSVHFFQLSFLFGFDYRKSSWLTTEK